jgi:RimJ/RimL family protein N-acetyltransferase
LGLSDLNQYNDLIKAVEDNLETKTFWLPITEKSRSHFFDKEWTRILGTFDGDKLIGAVGLFLNENEFGDSCKVLQIGNEGVAEYGRAMVLPEYRNHGVMTELSKRIIKYAEIIGIEVIVATVHPNNVASQSVVQKMGFKKRAFVVKNNEYDRDVFLLEVLE